MSRQVRQYATTEKSSNGTTGGQMDRMTTADAKNQVTEITRKRVDDLGTLALLDEIDEILEARPENFAKFYVQKGGE